MDGGGGVSYFMKSILALKMKEHILALKGKKNFSGLENEKEMKKLSPRQKWMNTISKYNSSLLCRVFEH